MPRTKKEVEPVEKEKNLLLVLKRLLLKNLAYQQKLLLKKHLLQRKQKQRKLLKPVQLRNRLQSQL